VESVPQFGQALPPAPTPSESVKAYTAVQKSTPAKVAGAYRPPGARGLATPSIFKREDEGGPGTHSGSATPPRYNRSPAPGAPGYGNKNDHANVDGYRSPQNGTKRHVPGALPSGSPRPAPEGSKNRKKKKKPQSQDGAATGASTPGEDGVSDGATQTESQGYGKKQDGQGNGRHAGGKEPSEHQGGILNMPPTAPTSSIPDVVVQSPDGALDPTAKKARNLNKKVSLLTRLLLRVELVTNVFCL
jgi:translation initiation factor 2A